MCWAMLQQIKDAVTNHANRHKQAVSSTTKYNEEAYLRRIPWIHVQVSELYLHFRYQSSKEIKLSDKKDCRNVTTAVWLLTGLVPEHYTSKPHCRRSKSWTSNDYSLHRWCFRKVKPSKCKQRLKKKYMLNVKERKTVSYLQNFTSCQSNFTFFYPDQAQFFNLNRRIGCPILHQIFLRQLKPPSMKTQHTNPYVI